MMGDIVCGMVVGAFVFSPVVMALVDHFVVGREVCHEG